MAAWQTWRSSSHRIGRHPWVKGYLLMCFLHLRDTRPRVFAVLTCAWLVSVASGIAAAQFNPSASKSSQVQNNSATIFAAYVYVGNNVSGNGNGYVTEYTIAGTGISLTTGASVTGASGSLNVNARYVFATDGTNIVTYTRDSNGGLRQTSSVNGIQHNITPQGSAVGSMTLDHTGQTLYAAEINYDGSDDDAYSAWSVGSNGVLTYINSYGINVDYHSPLGFSQNNHYAYGYGCYFASWDVFGFVRNSDGTLSSLNPNAAIPPGSGDPMYCPNDLAVSAMNYVVVAYDDVSSPGSNYLLAVYTLNSDGTLGLVNNSEVTTPFTGETSAVFDPSGTYLAVAGNAGIQMYRLQSGGTLAAVGSVVESNVSFTELRWDNSNHVYAISNSGLYVFASANGVLTKSPGSPLPTTDAGSLAVLPAQ